MNNLKYQNYFRLNIRKDDIETFELFKEMTKRDKRILATIKERDLKKGHVCPAIMFLIKDYVAKYKEAYQRKSSNA